MNEILDDLKIHFTPYYIHYFNLIQTAEKDAIESHGSIAKGLKSALLNDIKLKVEEKLA